MGRNTRLYSFTSDFRRFSLLLTLLLGFSFAHGQDTIRAMTYNFLLYGGTQSGCTPAGTSPRNPYINIIANAIRPDIICANEIGPNALHAENILVNALRPINPFYERSDLMNPSGSNLANFLFWNSAKLAVKSHSVIPNSLRDAQFFRMYYKDANLATTQDTTFFCVVCMHLKAGNGSSDASSRAAQALDVMNYLGTNAPGENVLVMGDMNVYSSNEAAYQTMTTFSNAAARVNDPVSTPGSWGGNGTYAALHTQSTRNSAGSDCGSGGGLDDRFDHILLSSAIITQSDKVGYVPGSYKAFGNDGQHFNKGITDAPTNTAVSTTVAGALAANSDHLPVICDLAVDGTPLSLEALMTPEFSVDILGNPVDANLGIRITLPEGRSYPLSITVRDMAGRALLHQDLTPQSGAQEVNISLQGLAAGLYLLDIVAPDAGHVVKKLIKS